MAVNINCLKKIFRSLLVPEKFGLTLNKFFQCYREMENEDVPFRELGFSSRYELLKSLNDVVYLKNSENGELRVYAIETSETEHINTMIQEQNDVRRPPRRPRNRTAPRFDSNRSHQHDSWNTGRNPSSKYQSSVQSRLSFRAPRSTSQFSNQPRRSESFGGYQTKNFKYDDKASRLKENDDKLKLMTRIDDIPIKQVTKEKEIPTKSVESSIEHRPDPECVNMNKTIETPLPKTEYPVKSIIQEEQLVSLESGIVSFDVHDVELDNLPEAPIVDSLFAVGELIQICIPQVHNPFKFWFHLEKRVEHLELLMSQLARFYVFEKTDPISNQELDISWVKIGKIYAALYRGEWHRGRVIRINGPMIKIFYVDYGTIEEITVDHLRYLANEFTKSPAFAYRGCLDMVRSNVGLWTLRTMRLFEQTMKTYLYEMITGTITGINKMERTIYLTLVDTKKLPDIDIGEHLIASNCAYKCKKSLTEFKRRHYNEIYPSFDDIESGKYPSIEEIIYWYDVQNFDFLEYDESLLKPEFVGYETIE